MATRISVPFVFPKIPYYFINANCHPKNIGEMVCKVGYELNERFKLCGRIINALEKDGWTVRAFADSCLAQHPDVFDEAQANLRLNSIGVDPSSVIISNTWDDWFNHVVS